MTKKSPIHVEINEVPDFVEFPITAAVVALPSASEAQLIAHDVWPPHLSSLRYAIQ